MMPHRTPRRPPLLAFLRDLALSLPAFHLRRHQTIVGGPFVAIPVDTVRPESPLTAVLGGSADSWRREREPEQAR